MYAASNIDLPLYMVLGHWKRTIYWTMSSHFNDHMYSSKHSQQSTPLQFCSEQQNCSWHKNQCKRKNKATVNGRILYARRREKALEQMLYEVNEQSENTTL